MIHLVAYMLLSALKIEIQKIKVLKMKINCDTISSIYATYWIKEENLK